MDGKNLGGLNGGGGVRRALEEGDSSSPAFPPLAQPSSPSEVAVVTRVPALFSTHRMTAEGFLHSAGQRGSVMGPLTRMTREVLPLLAPPYGVIPIVSNLIVLFLLETWGLPLPDTIQDLERQ